MSNISSSSMASVRTDHAAVDSSIVEAARDLERANAGMASIILTLIISVTRSVCSRSSANTVV